ncbi:hypothetical protein V5N11_026014 [Cardamine amara subsp. amara]|uniref:CCHC-type domain-containing protein n=1 Tax=Cardamine amara subsp. amara TaxID=228776 RepID=A0ABD1CAD0_CARAN
MPGRPKKKRVKAAHESPKKPGKSSRGGRIVTCSNCGQTGHNCGTCKNPRKVMEGPKRGCGRPRKAPVDGNTRPPKKRKQTQSQSSIPTSIDNVTCPTYSSAPEPSALQSTNGRGHGRGRGRGCGRGRPSGPAKKAVRKETIPRGFGCYISPFTNRIFDVRGNKAVELGGSNQRPSAHPSSQGLP